MMHARQAGLTLVELMVVVAVMTIIATIAYPMYTAQVQKSRRADAKVALQSIALAQERFFTINGEYTAGLSTLSMGTTSERGYYDLSITLAGADNEQFTATADAADPGSQASDTNCAQFAIDQLGVKDATDGGGTNCW